MSYPRNFSDFLSFIFDLHPIRRGLSRRSSGRATLHRPFCLPSGGHARRRAALVFDDWRHRVLAKHRIGSRVIPATLSDDRFGLRPGRRGDIAIDCPHRDFQFLRELCGRNLPQHAARKTRRIVRQTAARGMAITPDKTLSAELTYTLRPCR